MIRARSFECPLNEDQKFKLWSQVVDVAGKTAYALIWAVVGIYALSYVRDGVVALAGKDTSANIFIDVIARIQLDRWVAYLFGASGIAYGVSERRLRQKNIKRLTKQNEALESRLDPRRTSSNLTETGKSRREDR